MTREAFRISGTAISVRALPVSLEAHVPDQHFATGAFIGEQLAASSRARIRFNTDKPHISFAGRTDIRSGLGMNNGWRLEIDIAGDFHAYLRASERSI
jgi:hypothetical protein